MQGGKIIHHLQGHINAFDLLRLEREMRLTLKIMPLILLCCPISKVDVGRLNIGINNLNFFFILTLLQSGKIASDMKVYMK